MKKLLFLFLLLSSCSQETKRGLEAIDVPVVSPHAVMKLSEIASEVKCVPLEMNDSVLIGEVHRIVARDGFYYVAEGFSVHKFDREGKLISSVRRKGQGPAEYLNINDMQVDENGRVWVLSNRSKAMYCYKADGTFIDKVPLSLYLAFTMHYLGGGKMLVYSGFWKDKDNAYQLQLVDLDTKEILSKDRPIDDHRATYMYFMMPDNFFGAGDDTYFYQIMNDTVYSVDKQGKTQPSVVLNFTGKNIPESFFARSYEDVRDFMENHLNKEDYAYFNSLFVKKARTYWLTYIYNKRRFWYAGDGKSGKSAPVLVDDCRLKGYPIELDKIFSYFVLDDGSVAFLLQPYAVMEYAEEQLDEADKERLSRTLHYVDDEQNPVLLIVWI